MEVRALTGLGTVVRRRGVGYLAYLLTGVTAPRLAYQLVWGPAAPAPIRKVFRRASRRLARKVPIDAPLPLNRSVGWIEAVMDRAHAAGLTGLRQGLDAPLTALRRHRDRGAVFAAERDADRCAFNARFNRAILTEARARRLLEEVRSKVTTYHDYAPIDFGGGLTVGQVASSDSGTGRWEVFNRPVVAPLVDGRRVLDLGSNNGSMPLMMLRSGARSVVGIEGSPEIADLARLNAQVLAWRDIRSYDIRIVTGDMRRCLDDDFGAFDVVTAFCSLYYIPEPDMARIIARAAGWGATLVLQANEAIDNLPARAATLRRLMQENGYPDVETHEFPGFARALLVGRGSGR
jgi:SAM-dependent methyltransferase